MCTETGKLQRRSFHFPISFELRPIQDVAQLRNSGDRFETYAASLAYLAIGYEFALTGFAGTFAEDMPGRTAWKAGTRTTKNVGYSTMTDCSVLKSPISKQRSSDARGTCSTLRCRDRFCSIFSGHIKTGVPTVGGVEVPCRQAFVPWK